MSELPILEILQRRFAGRSDGLRTKPSGVRIEERRWQRALDDLDRECETLKRRMVRRSRADRQD
jgi:hypothetical protein